MNRLSDFLAPENCNVRFQIWLSFISSDLMHASQA
jgi:hypothetical protein